jgi:hypothetical protein
MASSEGVTAAHRMAATTHCGMTPTPGVATATTMLSERRHGSQDGTQDTHRQNNAFTFDTHVSLLNHRMDCSTLSVERSSWRSVDITAA